MTPPKEKVAAAIDRARAELDQALADLEQVPAFDPGIVGSATHALNNYLTVTEGTIDLLEMALEGYPNPDVHNWLRALRQASHLMLHTTSQLMKSSTSRGPKLIFGPVDVVTALRRACHFYQRVADPKRIRILCEPADDVPLVQTDRVAAAAVLDNLLSNAVKYSEPGKRVWVRARPDTDSVIISVQDEGPGLRPEQQTRLFQRGVRLGTKPTAGEPSTGFGLAVAKDLVGQLGGTIWCDSEAGKGACFSFRLPISRDGD
jgi:signal transduction histidine kinase